MGAGSLGDHWNIVARCVRFFDGGRHGARRHSFRRRAQWHQRQQARSGVDVLLIQLQGGMNVVASTKTDAQGLYHIDNAAIGAGPMLIRAVYRGVFFHQPLTPGTSTVDVTIYEPTTNPMPCRFRCASSCSNPTETS